MALGHVDRDWNEVRFLAFLFLLDLDPSKFGAAKRSNTDGLFGKSVVGIGLKQ